MASSKLTLTSNAGGTIAVQPTAAQTGALTVDLPAVNGTLIAANTAIGTAGQVVTTDGANIYWAAGGGSSFNPASPGPIGNATPNTGAFTTVSATVGIRNPTWATGCQPGTAVTGQQGYNTTTGKIETYSGSAWVAAGGPGAACNNTWTGTNAFNNNLTVGNTLTANGSVGTTSQVLMSGGANNPPQWICGSALVSAASPNVVSYTSSTTFTVTTPGTYTIHVMGAGGGGGSASINNCGIPVRATGGGAGGYARKTALLVAGCYNISIGAGGPGGAGSSGPTFNPGTAGGTTTFSGPGITTITANGGGAGSANSGPGTTTGATGGTATGGDVNVTGGGSGPATISCGGSRASSGGGAVGVLGVSYSSNTPTVGVPTSRSPGAGVGGSGGTAGNAGLGYAFPFGGLTGPAGAGSSSCAPGGLFSGGGGGGSASGGGGGTGGGGGGGSAFNTGGGTPAGAGGGGMVIITK